MHRAVASATQVARSGTDYPSRLVGATGAGALLGFVIDSIAGIFPWGLVTGLLVGAGIGAYEVVLLYNQAMDREQARRGYGASRMSDAVLPIAASAGPHNDVEWRLALDMLRRGAWVVPVLALVFGLTRGLDAAGAALAGGAVVAGNFLLSSFAVSRAARISIHIAAAAALFGFLLRLLLLGGVLYLLLEVVGLDRIPVVVTAAVTYVVLLVLEAAALTRGAVAPGGRVLRRPLSRDRAVGGTASPQPPPPPAHRPAADSVPPTRSGGFGGTASPQPPPQAHRPAADSVPPMRSGGFGGRRARSRRRRRTGQRRTASPR